MWSFSRIRVSRMPVRGSHSHPKWFIILFIAVSIGLFFFLDGWNTLVFPTDDSRPCLSFDSGLPVGVEDSKIVLCPDRVHLVEYFLIRTDQSLIDCQGSIVKGTGGALLLPEGVVNPRVTLKDCVLEGYEGLYSSRNPVDVYIVN